MGEMAPSSSFSSVRSRVYDARMPNPRRRDGGSCFTCDACGPPEKYDAVVCLRPQDSGKEVSKMPEVGCSAWLPRDAARPVGESTVPPPALG